MEELDDTRLVSKPIASWKMKMISEVRYQALLRAARAAKFYLEHGEPELADDLEEALKEVDYLL